MNPDLINPTSVYLAIPCADGRLMSETAGSIAQCMGLFGALSMPSECSHVSLVRNLIAAQFLATPFEWLVCVDNDIRFTREDYELLLQPRDPDTKYFPPQSKAHSMIIAADAQPEPTRIDTATASGTRTRADALVVAEYPYKNDLLEPVKLGMGFVRIHRSVFRTLETLKNDRGTVNVPGANWDEIRNLCVAAEDADFDDIADVSRRLEEIASVVGQTVLSAEDTRGGSRLWQTSWQGRQFWDYFPSGPLVSQFVPTAQWKGEDHGFFTLCMLAGLVPRIETRTRLVHIGRKAYEYAGPDVGAGQ